MVFLHFLNTRARNQDLVLLRLFVHVKCTWACLLSILCLTVGPGGSPDENGETTMDALVMDGVTTNYHVL